MMKPKSKTEKCRSIRWKSAFIAIVLIGLGASAVRTSAQDKSFILLGDTHFDKLSLHDMPWLQANYPNDVSQVNNYSQITQYYFSRLISELLHQSQITAPGVAGILQMGDLQEGLAGNLSLATQMAREARDSLRAPSFIPPWILTKGNHEVTGPGGAEAFNSVILPFVQSELNQPVTATSYACTIGDVRFIVLDSYDSNLLTFLEYELTSSSAKYKVILTHMPVIPVTGRLWHLFQTDDVKRETLLNLIAKSKALVICGHLHKYSVVKRSTAYGPIVQIMVASVISDPAKNTPSAYTTTYDASLVDLEPTFDPSTQSSRKAYLTKEAAYVTDYRMAEMPGYGVLSLNSATGAWTLKAYAGLGEQLYETVSLISYRLRVNPVGTGTATISPNDSVFLVGSKVVLTADPALGWKFDGWSGDRSGRLNPDTVVMDGDKNITATFSQIPAGQYEVRRTLVGSGVVVAEPPGPYYSLGTVVTLKARSNAGSRFVGWSGDVNGTDTVLTVRVDGHKSVTATFKKLESYRIDVRPGQHGSVTLEPSGGVYVEGTTVTVRGQGDPGWELYEWLGDVNSKASTQSLMVDGNKEVRAVFRKTGGGVQEIGASHDSYVQGFLKASTNFNGDSCLRVQEGSSDMNRSRAYLQFDIHGVVGNVLGAVLKMRVRESGLPDGGGVGGGVYGVSSDSWTETTLKWNGAPVVGSLLDSVMVSSMGKQYGWDVGTYVLGESRGDKVVSMMIKDHAATEKRIEFERREDGKGPVLAVMTDVASGVEKETEVPRECALHQNYPNPFNPRTIITYDLIGRGEVSIQIYDILGRGIKKLVDEMQGPGSLSVAWNGRDDSERPVESGIYVMRFQFGDRVTNSKMILLK